MQPVPIAIPMKEKTCERKEVKGVRGSEEREGVGEEMRREDER